MHLMFGWSMIDLFYNYVLNIYHKLLINNEIYMQIKRYSFLFSKSEKRSCHQVILKHRMVKHTEKKKRLLIFIIVGTVMSVKHSCIINFTMNSQKLSA